MGFYSYQVQADEVVMLPEHLLALDKGYNVFNVRVVGDPDQFDKRLAELNVKVLKRACLDELEPIPSDLKPLSDGVVPFLEEGR